MHLAWAVVACGDAGVEPGEATSPALTGKGDGAQQASAPGRRSVCRNDADCFGGSLEQTFGPIGALEPVGAACVHLVEATPVCECRTQLTPTAVDGASPRPHEVHAYPGNRTGGCSEWSFPPGCLYCESEFPGCNVDDPTSCDAVCGDMFQRFEAEFQRVTVATARLSRCSPDGSQCHVVTEIEGRCYAGAPFAGPTAELDCNLSDEELISHLEDPPSPSCAHPSPVPCESASDCPRGLACNAGVCGACSEFCSYPIGRPDLAVCEGDAACASGESCTLGRCVPSSNIGCRFSEECEAEQRCVLSGVSSVGRGNGQTRSFCQD